MVANSNAGSYGPRAQRANRRRSRQVGQNSNAELAPRSSRSMQRSAQRVMRNSDQEKFKTCQGSSCQNMPAASPIKLCKRIASDCIQCMCMSASLILGPWLLVLGSWSLALGKYVHHLSEIRYSQYLLWIIRMMNIDLHYNCFWLWVFLSLGIFGSWYIYIYLAL